MSKFKIVNLIDKLFICFSIFIIIYAWLNFYIRNLVPTFILSLIFSLSLTYILFYILNKKQTKKRLANEKINLINKTFLAFKLSNSKEKFKLLAQVFCDDCEYKISKNTLTFVKDNSSFSIVVFLGKILTQEDLLNLLTLHEIKTQNLIVVCENFSNSISCKILKNLEIKIVDKDSLFLNYFEAKNIYPNCDILDDTILKPNLKNLYKKFFQTKKSKQYFWLGLLMIFSSFILPFKIYYLIFGSGFLVCAILCKILKF